MIQENESLRFYTNNVLRKYLDIEGLTEIAINRPNEVFCEIDGQWSQHKDEKVSLAFCQQFATTLAQFNNDTINDLKSLLSATMLDGERVQVVYPPSCTRDTVSITIRKPSTRQIFAKSYEENGFYTRVQQSAISDTADAELIRLYKARQIPEFMYKAVEMGKSIVFAGGTGSGKTTYMKSLIDFIPLDTRLITIEDTSEIRFFKHQNYVQLYYPSQSARTDALVTSGDLLISCFRMKPDRILLAEVRGAEAWDFIKAVTSGHSGSMTSLHAGSAAEAVTALIEKCSEHHANANTKREALKLRVLSSIDIICHIEADHGVRNMGDIYFKAVDKNRFLADESI